MHKNVLTFDNYHTVQTTMRFTLPVIITLVNRTMFVSILALFPIDKFFSIFEKKPFAGCSL